MLCLAILKVSENLMCVHFLFFFIFSPPFLTLVYRCELNASTSFCFFSFSPSISFSFPLFFSEIYEIFISLFLLVAHRITIIFWREEINKIKQMFFFIITYVIYSFCLMSQKGIHVQRRIKR